MGSSENRFWQILIVFVSVSVEHRKTFSCISWESSSREVTSNGTSQQRSNPAVAPVFNKLAGHQRQPLDSHSVPAAEQCVDKGCGVLTLCQEGTPCRRHIQVIPAITAAPPTACSLLLHPLTHFTCSGGGGGGGFVAWHDHHLWGTLHFQVFAALWKCSRSCFMASNVSNGLLFSPQIS